MNFSNVKDKYDHYFKYSEIEEKIKNYAKKHKDLCKINVLGKTLEGRDILLLEITNTKTGDFSSKPAFYIEGNLHAGEVTGSMVSMYFLDLIFSNLEEKEIKEMLDTKTLYILPRVSPDGSEYYLTTPDSVRSLPKFYPYSEEKEGLQPSDIDNDGVIRKMRVKDKFGIWKVSDKDPRAMAKRKPDDIEGEFYSVYSEGLIKDYDGFEIKSAPQKYGLDFNRGYPIDWQDESKQHGAGPYPLSVTETKANANFLFDHDNICAAIDLHTSGGVIMYTPGYMPPKECAKEDVNIGRKITLMGEEETGYKSLQAYDFTDPKNAIPGAFDDFCHLRIGIPCFTVELWDHANKAGINVLYPPKPLTDLEEEENYIKYLKWLDEKYEGKGFKNWTKFNHPQLGEVEIGGFDFKYTIQNPPASELSEIGKNMSKFFLRELKTFPNVFVRDFIKEKVSDDVYKLKLVVGNKGFMPTYVFKEGLKLNRVKPLEVKISGVTLVEGKEVTDISHLEGYANTMGTNNRRGPTTGDNTVCEKVLTYVCKAKKGQKVTFNIKGAKIGSKNFEFEI